LQQAQAHGGGGGRLLEVALEGVAVASGSKEFMERGSVGKKVRQHTPSTEAV